MNAVAAAKKKAEAALKAVGIVDGFTVKQKELPRSHEHDVALYRARSQFRSRPIFWVSNSLVDEDELLLSLLHEYGHVIAEWAAMRDPSLLEQLQSGWRDEDGLFDEEDWAEHFARVVAGSEVRGMGAVLDVVDSYVNSLLPL